MEEIAAPGAPEGSIVGDCAFDDIYHMLGAAGGESSDGGLLDESNVAFFLTRDDVVHDKRNLGGDGFLNGREALWCVYLIRDFKSFLLRISRAERVSSTRRRRHAKR